MPKNGFLARVLHGLQLARAELARLTVSLTASLIDHL